MNKVLILYGQGIIGAVMSNVLDRANRAQVLRVNYVDRSLLDEDIKQFQPDVVIIDEQLDRAEPTLIFDLLNREPSIRVIVAAIEENVAHIYERRSLLIRSSNDVVLAAERPVKVSLQ